MFINITVISYGRCDIFWEEGRLKYLSNKIQTLIVTSYQFSNEPLASDYEPTDTSLLQGPNQNLFHNCAAYKIVVMCSKSCNGFKVESRV